MVIQRSWKILSDTGSTSASSTEANRSPSGLHSSSDDSNCSNQTTHSMVTSVASPPSIKLDMNATPSTEPMKFVTTTQMAETMLQRLKQRLGGPVAGSAATSESVMRSLELLRISVQTAFDKEIDEVVKRFMENYFKPAFNNIKENLGQNAVSEDTLQKMSCALLENSKAQYNAFRTKPQTAYITTHAATTDHTMRLAIKRPAGKPTAVNELSKKLFPAATCQQQQQPAQNQPSIVAAVKPTFCLSQPTTLLQQKTPVAVAPMRRQIFWNTANISTATKFVLDVQANQAFGFGTDGKERLASKHPELIRYLPDSEDRDWLIAQNIISQQNHNSRFLFLIHDEVCRLQQTHEIYRTKPNVDLQKMCTFTVPEFMIQKMKLFFVDLNIKSRGLITNSFSVGATMQGNSHLRNALLQGIQSTSTGVGVTETVTTATVNSVITSSDSAVISMPVSTVSQKPKASTLSSSHATLTALLNNSASASGSSDKVASNGNGKLRK